MSQDDLAAVGAFALYRFEHSHRVHEFEKQDNAQALIQADFEQFKGKYLRKFADIRAQMAAHGLEIAPSDRIAA